MNLRADERANLEQFLERHRTGVRKALDGLSEADAAARLLPYTDMTIGGIVKHLAQMEDLWFSWKFAGADWPSPWPHGEREEWAWASAGADTVAELAALYDAACERSRAVTAGRLLDEPAASASFGKGPASLRWILVQMTVETAQHQGHLDLMLDVLKG